MKKQFLIFFTFLFSLSFGQRIKYSELVLTFNNMSDEEVRIELKEFMAGDNTEPNSYFRLASIYEKVYRAADPLTDYELVMANAQEAASRFIKPVGS